jgi:hypothetical protein
MRYISRITVGTLLLTLSSAYAQSGDMSSPNTPTSQDVTGTAPQANPSDSQAGATNPQPTPGITTPTLFGAMTPDNIQWIAAPALLPSGAKFTLLEGNPRSRGNVTVRIKLPANYQLPPVYTIMPERITVLSGTLHLGAGNKIDANASTSLPTGSFVVIPAKKHHYFWTSDESIIQISGPGPWSLKYVNPTDDPRNNKGLNTNAPTSGNQAPVGQQQNNAPSSNPPANSGPSQ